MNNKPTLTVNNQSADSNFKGIILFYLSAWEGKKSVPLKLEMREMGSHASGNGS